MITPKRYDGVRGTTWTIRFRYGGGTTSETFDTEAEAWDFSKAIDFLGPKGALDRLYEGGTQKTTGPTFAEYVTQHVDSLTRPSPPTKRKYRQIVRDHWTAELGNRRLDTIDRHAIAAVINGWAADGASDKSIKNWWGVVAPAFHVASRDGVIAKDPTIGIKLPRNTEHETEEMVILDAADAARLLAEIHDNYKPLFLTLLDTGMRWGEAAALDVGDVNPREQTIRITKAMKQNGDIGPTKTKASKRTIYYNDTIADVMAPLMAGRGKKVPLFTAPRGGRVHHRTFWSDIWRPAVWRAQHCGEHFEPDCRCGTAHPERCRIHVDEVPAPCGCDGTLTVAPRIHDLRHTHASTLLAANVPVHIVQDRLGHESIKTTVDTYGHLRSDHQKLAAQVGALSLTPPSQTALPSADG